MYLPTVHAPSCWKSRDFEVGFFFGVATWTFEVGAPKCGSCGDVFKLGRRSCFVGGWDEEGLYEWRGGEACAGTEVLGKGDVVGGLWGLLFSFEIWRVWLGWRVRDLGVVVSCGLCQQ